jgi:hypothetical protein
MHKLLLVLTFLSAKMLVAQSPKSYNLVRDKQNPLIVHVKWDPQQFKEYSPKDSILVEAILENGYHLTKMCSITNGDLEYRLPEREQQIKVYYVVALNKRKRREPELMVLDIPQPAVSNAPIPMPVTWKIGMTWSDDNKVMKEEMSQLVNELNIALKGEVTFEWVKEPKSRLEHWFHAVQSNEIQLLHTSSSYWKDSIPCTIFLSHHPFGMTQEKMEKWLKAEGLKLVQEQFEKHRLGVSICGHSGESMGGWFNREIRVVEDFKGMWIRNVAEQRREHVCPVKCINSCRATKKEIEVLSLWVRMRIAILDYITWENIIMELGVITIPHFFYCLI